MTELPKEESSQSDTRSLPEEWHKLRDGANIGAPGKTWSKAFLWGNFTFSQKSLLGNFDFFLVPLFHSCLEIPHAGFHGGKLSLLGFSKIKIDQVLAVEM